MEQNSKAPIIEPMQPPKTQTVVHFLTTDFPPSHGGLELYAHKLATELEAICEVSAALGNNQPPTDLPQNRVWHWHRGRHRLAASLWSTWDCTRSPAQGITRLHLQWNTALASAWQRKNRRLKQLWICAHGAELIQSNPITHQIMMWVFHQADCIVTGSQYTAKLVHELGISENRIRVNAYGVEIPGWQRRPPIETFAGRWKILCTHRLVPRKGTRLLLSALNELQHLPWDITLIGTGEEQKELESDVAQMGLQNRVRFLGSLTQQEKSTHLRESDLFVLPSLPPLGNNHIEGLGIGLLEAQAHGVAVLGANTGGIPEALYARETGLLFEAGSKTALCGALQELYGVFVHSPEKYATFGEKGRAWVQSHFSWEKNLRQWHEWLSQPNG